MDLTRKVNRARRKVGKKINHFPVQKAIYQFDESLKRVWREEKSLYEFLYAFGT